MSLDKPRLVTDHNPNTMIGEEHLKDDLFQFELQLIQHAQQGDAAAFASLVEIYWPLIHSYSFTLVQEYELAADLTQETFFRAYRGIKNLRVNESNQLQFKPWLYKIATNLVWTHHAKNKKKRDWLSLDQLGLQRNAAINQLADRQPGPVEQSLTAEQQNEILAVFKALPRDQVSLLILRYHHDLNNNEIGEILSIRNDAVRGRLRRARLAFARIYNELFGGDNL